MNRFLIAVSVLIVGFVWVDFGAAEAFQALVVLGCLGSILFAYNIDFRSDDMVIKKGDKILDNLEFVSGIVQNVKPKGVKVIWEPDGETRWIRPDKIRDVWFGDTREKRFSIVPKSGGDE